MKRFSPVTYGRDVRVSPQDPKTIYAALSAAAASHDGGLYRSQDAGQTWRRFDKVQVHGTIMSVALHPTDPNHAGGELDAARRRHSRARSSSI